MKFSQNNNPVIKAALARLVEKGLVSEKEGNYKITEAGTEEYRKAVGNGCPKSTPTITPKRGA